MVDTNDLKHCPACRSTTLAPAFASETHSHNSLNRLGKDLPPGIDPAFLKSFNRVHWSICKDFELIFAGLRPADAGSSAWYLPPFKHSEERGYDAFPLPETYVSSKAKSNARLYEIITARGLIPRGARLLQVRFATGELLRLAKQHLDADVWGLDFFRPVSLMPMRFWVRHALPKWPS